MRCCPAQTSIKCVAYLCPPPGEYLPLHVVKESEVILDLVPDLAVAALHHQRTLLKGKGVHRPEGSRIAAEACEANLSERGTNMAMVGSGRSSRSSRSVSRDSAAM